MDEQAKLTASDAAATDFFGFSVAVSGDTIVVGAYLDDAPASQSGSAYVFVRSGSTWNEQAKLTASDAAVADRFGVSVAVSGDTAAVGATHDDHSGGLTVGSAYVFLRSGTSWSEQAKLTASDGKAFEQFGNSVALSGDTAVVGAYQDSHEGGGGAGSAYVFLRSGVLPSHCNCCNGGNGLGCNCQPCEDLVCASDPFCCNELWDEFCDLQATTMCTCCTGFCDGFGGGWLEQAKLTASDAAGGDNFGVSVALSGDTAVVGADIDDHAGGNLAGSAYVFGIPTGGDDEVDLCPDTVIPESVPTNNLGVNRWALVDEDLSFDTTAPPGGGNGPTSSSR